jgi:antitoxin (DNA-binding transcriptional repressor) of toxin-antitoxin stability system
MDQIPAKAARQGFFGLLRSPKRVLITVRGKAVAAMVGPMDARVLEHLDKTERMSKIIEEMEDTRASE